MMRILLINPPTPNTILNKEYYLPSSLLYIAAALQQINTEVQILDLSIFKPEKHENSQQFCEDIMVDRISVFKPALIGFGCLFSGHFPFIRRSSEKIKKIFKTIPIVIGGIHPTIYPQEILAHCPYIDWIVMGEGEVSVVQLVKEIKQGSYNFANIDGLAYRKNGQVVINAKRHFIANLDNLPFPSYNLININDYYHDTSRWYNPRNLSINASLPIISSRSCPMRCNFCSMFLAMGPKWRNRSAKNVADEIEFLYHKYNHRHFSFMDDNLTLQKSHIIELCHEIIKRNLIIQFETPNGVSTGTFDAEVIENLVSAGLVRVTFAIESGSDFIRNQVMGKRLSRNKIYEVINLTKKYKERLYVRAFFIMGMPEDTMETLEETYRMIKEIDVDKPIVTNLVPFPGTKLFEQALRDNLFIDDLDLENLWKTETFYFTDNKRFFIKPYNLNLSQLQEYRQKFDQLIAECLKRKARERKRDYQDANKN